MNKDVSNVIAGASAVSPWWLQHIGHMSDIAAVILPILGCAWLGVQIIGFLWDKWNGK